MASSRRSPRRNSPLSADLWAQSAKLDPADGDSYDSFGRSVAVNGDTLVVGAYKDEDSNGDAAGSAYIFERGSGWGGGHINQVAKLDPDVGHGRARLRPAVEPPGV